MDLTQGLLLFTITALPILLAVTLHEAAHAWAANRLGDDTAKHLGRLSLNPLVHIDPFGTVLLPGLLLLLGSGFLFGYAKPVPVRTDRLSNPKRDMIFVAAAGPAANFLIAVISVLLLVVVQPLAGSFSAWTENTLRFSIYFNCLIACFNLLPIPPLDGSRILTGLLPMPQARAFARLDKAGMLIILGVFFLLPMATGIDLFQPLVAQPARFIQSVLLAMTGLAP